MKEKRTFWQWIKRGIKSPATRGFCLLIGSIASFIFGCYLATEINFIFLLFAPLGILGFLYFLYWLDYGDSL